jgi:murein DD-endopeptidase MepM/ murein hydrolase activator NlpD
VLALALAVLPALAGEAWPEARPEARPRPDPALARQVAAELATLDRARSAVGAKLGAADAARARRLAAAYRLLRPQPAGATAGSPTAGSPTAGSSMVARRRAAVRLLLERELAERRLLAGEGAQLHRAAAEKQAQAGRVPEIVLPAEIGRPARGKIVRRFGTVRHERSNATIARRGIDLEVDAQSPAVAPADGVVRYAGPIRGLDAGVIIDHGSFLTVIGKLGAVSVPVGAPVRGGDQLGLAARRRVYLEVRVKLGTGGFPIDPEPLLPGRKSSEPR